MPAHQVISLEHAVALGNRDRATIERKLQRALRRLAAMPEMLLLFQHVILDVADRECPAFQQPHHLARIGGLYVGEPAMPLALVQSHVGDEEAEVPCGYIGQRMRPIFEYALVE